ncbi:unnamed protein product [Pylaiella littoralis]
MLPITEGERSATMRPSSWNTPAAVLFPRYISYDRPRAAPVVEGSASQESTPASAGQTIEVVNPYTR